MKTKVLQLDKDFNPKFLESLPTLNYEEFTFPDGTYHIKVQHHTDVRKVFISTRDYLDLTRLAIVVDAVRRVMGSDVIINLILPYFPGARQDRVSVDGEPLTLKVTSELINNMKFKNIITYDVHNKSIYLALNRLGNLLNVQFIEEIFQKEKLTKDEKICIITPDEGASKKIYPLFKHLKGKYNNIHLIEATKYRNPENGNLSRFKLPDNVEGLKDAKCYVIDDISSYGGTFKGLAQEVENIGEHKSLNLIVTHGEFGIGKGEDKRCEVVEGLHVFYDKIYYSDSLPKVEGDYDFLTQIRFI